MLSGEKVSLRPWCREDIEALMIMRNDAALQKLLMTQPRPNSRERVIQWLTEKSSQDNAVFFVIAESTGGHAVGYVQVVDIDQLHCRGNLGICLAADVQGRGYGTETLQLLEPYLQKNLGLRKVVLQVLADNESAIALYRKAGYREVGYLKEHFLFDGSFMDVLIMEKIIYS